MVTVEITSRFGRPLTVVDLSADGEPENVQLGMAVRKAHGAGIDLSDALLSRASLVNANLAGANLAHAYLAGANLARADLTDANLARANLTDAYLAHADLTDANLAGADLAGADLTDANLAGAYLAGANLARADLTDANLARANLAGANLAHAYLAGANLAGANLAGANLAHAYLAGANLTGTNISDRIIDGGCRADGYRFKLTRTEPGPWRVKAGCRNFTVPEATAHWKNTRGGTPLGDETMAIIMNMMALARIRKWPLRGEED